MSTSGPTKECRLCHRIGTRGFVPAGGENHIWECSNDRACTNRVKARKPQPEERDDHE